MTFVLGFGSTEKAFEEAEEEAIRQFIAKAYAEMGFGYISLELVQKVSAWCEERAAQHRAKADEYKDSETYPERYSQYWSSVAHNASHIVVILTFHHINRRHPISPDGWALWTTERLVHVKANDLSLRKAA